MSSRNLPGPIGPACRGTDLYLWFGPDDDQPAELPGERRRRESAAMGVCAGCPVRAACLAEELSRPTGQQWGVRGGMTATERRAVTRRQRRTAAAVVRALIPEAGTTVASPEVAA